MKYEEHVISTIVELEERKKKQIKLLEVLNIHQRFTTLEYYPIKKLLVLYNYLSDLSIENPFNPDVDELFSSAENSTLNGRIHTQLKVVERIINLPAEVPSFIIKSYFGIVNSYGYRSTHLKGRIYGCRNTMTLISRQCRYYLFKNLYYDLDLKNAHPTILLSYANNNNLKVEVLKKYVDNREDFLKDVMERDGLTRGEAKTAVLRCLNLVSDKSLTNSLKSLHEDILIIREYLYKENISEKVTLLGEYTMSRESFKRKNIQKQKVSLQSQYCATQESECLYILYEVCIQKGLLDRDAALNNKIGSISFIPFFDGAYVRVKNSTVSEMKQILEDTNELISPCSFELKEIEPEWDFIEEDKIRKYEKMFDFLSVLTDAQYKKLLDILDIPPLSLDEEAIGDFKKRCTNRNVEKDKDELKRGIIGDEDLTKSINMSVKQYKYCLRKELLKYIDGEGFKQLKADLGVEWK